MPKASAIGKDATDAHHHLVTCPHRPQSGLVTANLMHAINDREQLRESSQLFWWRAMHTISKLVKCCAVENLMQRELETVRV